MTAATNPLSYNAYIDQVAAMAVYKTQVTAGVTSFLDAPPTLITPMILNYAELRIQRDLDLLASQSSNQYTLTAGQNVFSLPVDDFLTVQTVETVQLSNGQVVNSTPVLPVSKEFIQNVYGGLSSAGTPQYFAMYGSNFGDPGQDVNTNLLFGPPPNFGYTIRVTGTVRAPSLFQNATAGIADTGFTYISAYLPDLLIMASMIYISAFQRTFGPTSDTPESGMTYEKQYQALRIGAIAEENRRKQLGSAYSAYSTPVSATPTR